jgi:hypothetical protein
LQALQCNAAEMREYEYTSLTQIGRWSEVKRGEGMFESILAYENYPIDKRMREEVKEAKVEVRGGGSEEKTNYGITVVVVPGEEMRVKLMYDASKYERESIERMMRHLERIVEGLEEEGERRRRDREMVGGEEKREVTAEGNRTEAKYRRAATIGEVYDVEAADSVTEIEELSEGRRERNEDPND